MQPFQKFLLEASTPIEYLVKIQVKGTENTTETDSYMQCGEQCQWLDREENKCKLFKETLKTKIENNVATILRTKNCLQVTDALI